MEEGDAEVEKGSSNSWEGDMEEAEFGVGGGHSDDEDNTEQSDEQEEATDGIIFFFVVVSLFKKN